MSQSAALFQELGKHVSAEIVNKVKGVYLFKITGGDSWTVDLKNGTGAVKQGQEGTPDCTITIADEDFVNLITGKANGQQLFMSGKIKIAGNMALAMKLEVLKQMAPKGGVTPSAANGTEYKSDAIFPELAKRMQEDPTVVNKVGGVYLFIIGGANGAKKSWLVDAKNAPGSVKEGEGKADCTINIADGDFVDLITGKANGQQLFMGGKLKISGNMALAMKLGNLSAPRAAL